MEIIAIVKLKRYIVEVCIFDIIISKLIYKQELNLIVLFFMEKSIKISLYYAILFLILAVHLQIENNRKFLLNIKKIA